MSSSRNKEKGPGLTRSEALELVALGMVLGNPELRKMVNESDWGSVDMQCIVSELKTNGGSSKVYTYLERWLLEVCGVEWKPPGKPATALFAKLLRNTRKYRVVTELQRLGECAGRTLDIDLDKFFECLRKAYEQAGPEIEERKGGKDG